MKKIYFKFIGIECLYMILNIFAACLSAFLQFIGRIHTGEYEGLIFSGFNYSYNMFFYIVGLFTYVLYFLFSYLHFFSKKAGILNTWNFRWKLLYIFVAFLFSFLMFAALLFVPVFVIGFANNIEPEILFEFIWFGFPIATAIYMIKIAIVKK